MRDDQLHLADDGEVVLEQQVVVAMDAAADGVLHGQHAVSGAALIHGLEDELEALAGEQVGVVRVAKRGGLAIGPRLALIGDAHSPDRLHHRLSNWQNE